MPVAPVEPWFILKQSAAVWFFGNVILTSLASQGQKSPGSFRTLIIKVCVSD